MGIVNLTPDSFSDGGRFPDPEAAVAFAKTLVDSGAEMLDIGGESTRPGADPVSEADELARVIPVITALRAWSDIPLSIDTMKPAVARAAIAAGAVMWNDVTALTFAPDSLATAAELGCAMVLMHMKGDPRTMGAEAHYGEVVSDVAAALTLRAEAAIAAGVAKDKIWLDPGLGFAKTAQHSLSVLAHLEALVALGYPVLLGASRKSFIKAIDPAATESTGRLGASLAAALHGAGAGAAAVRVHDVRETRQALEMWETLQSYVR